MTPFITALAKRAGCLVRGIHNRFFIRKAFYSIHFFIYKLALNGMGVYYDGNAIGAGEQRFLSSYLGNKASPTVLDVGANAGQFATAAKLACPGAIIHSFEPHPASYKKLQSVARKLGLFAHNIACGESVGVFDLFDYSHIDGSEHASLYSEVFKDLGHDAVRSQQVQMDALDDFCAKHTIQHIDLLKIDVEGHESSVLRGARRLLEAQAIEVIQFEFNEMNIHSRVWFRDFVDLLPGFDFYRILPDGLVSLEPYLPIKCEIFSYQNVVAILRKS